MKSLRLNCTNFTTLAVSVCTSHVSFNDQQTTFYTIGSSILLCLSLLLNGICVYVLTFGERMNNKFLVILRHHSIVCFLMVCNDFTWLVCSLTFNTDWYDYEGILHSKVHYYALYHGYVFKNISTVLMTVGGTLNLTLVYERIRIYYTGLTFFENKKPIKTLLLIFIYSVISNLTLIVSNTVTRRDILLNGRDLISIYESHTTRKFYFEKVFLFFDFIFLFYDVLLLLIEVVMNFVLISLMTNYYRKKESIKMRNQKVTGKC